MGKDTYLEYKLDGDVVIYAYLTKEEAQQQIPELEAGNGLNYGALKFREGYILATRYYFRDAKGIPFEDMGDNSEYLNKTKAYHQICRETGHF